MARVTTFSIDDKTEQTLNEIREALGATSNAEVLRRAVNLLGVATRVVGDNGKVLIQNEEGKSREIVIT